MGRGWQKQKFEKKNMELNWNFRRGWGANKKKPPLGPGVHGCFLEPHNFTKDVIKHVPTCGTVSVVVSLMAVSM